jgi:transketolase
VGKLAELRSGDDLTIVANGIGVAIGLEAAERLSAEGVRAGVFDAHTIRPFDADGLIAAVEASRRLLVIEEHNTVGGLATACADALVDGQAAGVRVERLGMPSDEYSLIGPPTHLYAHYGLTAEGAYARALALLRDGSRKE